MELAERTLLDRWQEVREEGSPGLPRDELLGYFRQAAEGIDYLHARGVQHRDVKLQNLLLSGGVVKVGDFGLARAQVHSVTGHTGALTVAYAAPEFFDGKTARQSDQYGLAVTYCQLRGGRLPFAGTAARVMAGHLHQPPDLTMVPEAERPALARALSKAPGHRWPSCGACVEALADAGARGASPAGRRGRLRRAWPAAVAVVLGLAVLPFLPWGTPAPPQMLRSASAPPQVAAERVALVAQFDRPMVPMNVRCVAAGYVGAPLERPVAFTNGTGGPTLWDAETGKILQHFPSKGGPCVALAPFSKPLGLSGGDDGVITLWRLDSGIAVQRFLSDKKASISSVAFSPDGQQVLSGASDGTVRLWDRQSGEQLRRCVHGGIVTAVAFGPLGRRALSAGWDGAVRLWDLDGERQVKAFQGHTAKVRCVAFSPDGRYAASGADDCTIRLWDVQGGQEVRRLEGHREGVFGVAFWSYERLVSVGGGTIRIWDTVSGRQLHFADGLPSTGQCLSRFALSDRQHLLVGTEEDGLSLWRLFE